MLRLEQKHDQKVEYREMHGHLTRRKLSFILLKIECEYCKFGYKFPYPEKRLISVMTLRNKEDRHK